jgi:hypothetical protein
MVIHCREKWIEEYMNRQKKVYYIFSRRWVVPVENLNLNKNPLEHT